jgi:hypothetical protein
MRKDDELLDSRMDDEEDLFDLSLDDLQPEDTIVEPHVEEPDEEIIELIDLVEKSDIDFEEDEKGPDMAFKNNPEQAAENDILRDDETLDLLNIPLDQELSFDDFEEDETSEEGPGDAMIAGDDLKFFIEGDQPDETLEAPADFLDDISGESAPEETVTPEADTIETAIEDALEIGNDDLSVEQLLFANEKTVRLSRDDEQTQESLHDMTIEELEQPPGLDFENRTPVEESALRQELVPEKEELPLPSPSEEKFIGISEEKIEAILRKIVEEVMEKVARETMTHVEEIVEKAAKESMTSIAEKTITDAIEVLKKSIESASD